MMNEYAPAGKSQRKVSFFTLSFVRSVYVNQLAWIQRCRYRWYGASDYRRNPFHQKLDFESYAKCVFRLWFAGAKNECIQMYNSADIVTKSWTMQTVTTQMEHEYAQSKLSTEPSTCDSYDFRVRRVEVTQWIFRSERSPRKHWIKH